MNEIAKLYNKNHRVRVITSLKPFINALNKNKDWKCKRFGRANKPGKNATRAKTIPNKRLTATFEFLN
tara:strand:+ start:2198 stop:2401 length:204 start_codon:yes stop_codon:yes gene_type:complete